MTALTASSAIHTSDQKVRLTGISYGLGAGALWGFVFLAPELVRDFSPLQLVVGRYLCYGLIAAALVGPRWRSLAARFPRHQTMNLVWLSLAGNTVYYVMLSAAVQTGGIAMTSLVIGFLPVAVTVIGRRDNGAVPLRRLVPSLVLSAAGAICIGWQALLGPRLGSAESQVVGLLCAIGALTAWTTYAVGNARCLQRLERVSPHEWNLLLGVVAGAQSIVLLPFALAFETTHHAAGAWTRFAAVSIGLAVLASIVGNTLWNRMSRVLPLTLVGQMILFETLFALIYGFLWEQRLPTMLEMAAMAFVVTSVLSCLAAHARPAAVTSDVLRGRELPA